MKKILILVVVVLLTVPAFAANPTAKGNFVVSLPLFSYEQQSGDLYEVAGEKETVMTIGISDYQLGVEWFVIDNLAIGGALFYESESEADTTTQGIMPMITYYYAMNQLIPYAGIGYGYTTYDDGTDELTLTSLFFKAGAAYMLGNNLAAFGELGYSMDEVENGTSADGDILSINLGIKAFF